MSNNITFTGRVSAVLPVESGTSASGKSWSRQTIVITEEDVQYPGAIAVTLFKPELVGTGPQAKPSLRTCRCKRPNITANTTTTFPRGR